MSRNNIFDILEGELNINYEITVIMDLFNKAMLYERVCNYHLEEFCDKFCMPFWKSRKYVTSCAEMRARLKITDKDIKNGLDEQHVLMLLEYVLNIVALCDKQRGEGTEWSTDFYMLLENVISLAESLNYEAKPIEEEEKTILVEKNAAATAVAEIMDSTSAYFVIEYNHYLLKENLLKKKQILKALGDKFEGIRPKIKSINKSLESDIGFLLNKLNIRHNNMEGMSAEKLVQNMSKEELEQWYDDTYQLLLLAFLEVDNLPRRQKVSTLQQNYEGKHRD